jgi:heme A synthase
VESAQVWIHFAHRIGALLAFFGVIGFGTHILRTYHDDRRLREPAWIMILLVVVQVLLGALTVWTGKGVQVATSHVAAGALLFGATVFLTVRSFRRARVPALAATMGLAPQAARP